MFGPKPGVLLDGTPVTFGQALEVGIIIRRSDLFVHVIHGPEFDADPALTRRTLR